MDNQQRPHVILQDCQSYDQNIYGHRFKWKLRIYTVSPNMIPGKYLMEQLPEDANALDMHCPQSRQSKSCRQFAAVPKRQMHHVWNKAVPTLYRICFPLDSRFHSQEKTSRLSPCYKSPLDIRSLIWPAQENILAPLQTSIRRIRDQSSIS